MGRRQDIPFGVSLGKRPRSESEGAETGAKGDSVSASSLREEYRVKGVKLLYYGQVSTFAAFFALVFYNRCESRNLPII